MINRPSNADTLTLAKASWVRLIRKIYEAEPLTCSHCDSEMRFIAVVEEGPVIKRILRHVGAMDPQGPPEEDEWPVGGQIPLTF